MNRADKESHEIADQAARQDVKKEHPELPDVLPFFRVKGLSSTQCKVLAVCFLTARQAITVKCQAEMAGVNPKTWWYTVRLPKFLDALAVKSRELIGTKVPALVDVHIEDALIDDRAARRDLLQQYGILDRPQPANALTQIVNVTVLEKERHEKLGRGLNRFGVEVVTDD